MRLKGEALLDASVGFDKFQFQTGAIRRDMQDYNMEEVVEFQFQTGAIRSAKVAYVCHTC